MTVSARPVRDLSLPATVGSIDYEGERLVTGWHDHPLHQLEYAVHGVVEVETSGGRFVVPSQQAIWIPAGLSHQSIVSSAVRTVSVFLEPAMVPSDDRARVLAMTPLLREMVVHATRWPTSRHEGDEVGVRYFAALADVVADALGDERPLSLPTSTHPAVGSAMAWTLDHLAGARIEDASAAAHVSERTLRRLFEREVGLTWRTYLRHARLLRAMTLLSRPSATVLDVATSVGFDSVSSFTRAFVDQCGETPSAYRRRVRVAG